MILLRKFLTFPHNRSPYQLTYGAYEFIIDEFVIDGYKRIMLIYFGKKMRKDVINYEDRILTRLRAGAYDIILRQTYFTINKRDFTEYYSVNLCCEVSNMSYKKFFREYTRALQVALQVNNTKI